MATRLSGSNGVFGWVTSLSLVLILPEVTTIHVVRAEQRDEVRCVIEQAPMRDGVKLATEVYLPSGNGRFPVILQRTPYNRRAPAPGSDCDSATYGIGRYFAERGYVTLNQDTRGRYRSEGEFDAMRQEAKDGYDAVEWAAAQPWSNGKVGMIGGSYVGLTQWQAAIERPPHLVAIAPHYSSSDYHHGWTYQGGAFDLWFALSWTSQVLAPDTLQRRLEATEMSSEQVHQEVAQFVAKGQEDLLDDWVWEFPIKGFSAFRRNGNIAAYFDEWLARPSYDDYWATLDVETKYPRIQVPALVTGGWYDVFQEGTIRNFLGMRSAGGSKAARSGTKLIIRALCHACPGDTTAGEIDFGPQNTFDLNATWARWFDYWLKEIDNGIQDEPPVKLFVMLPPDEGTVGSGFWITADQFPLPDAIDTRFYLRSNGSANSARGDGVLTSEGPLGSPDQYIYDPHNPVPTVGGNMCCTNALLPSGAFDQREVEQREDVLVYTTSPLEEDLVVIGEVKVELWAKSSAPDTDFTAKLVDVHVDGYAQNVSEGIIRARYRNSNEKLSWITPDAVHNYSIDLGYTATVFREGHRIRLEVSSSNFPHFDRNPNTAVSFGQGAQLQKATQQVLHDQAHPSQLVLQVSPSIRIP